MDKGVFFTFEGIDGSGKSVQSAALAERLMAEGYEVLLVRDPGSSSIAEKIRSLLLDRNHSEMSPMAELFLYEAARAQLVSEIILPSLDSGTIVISDRFVDSTTAYQAFGRGIPLDFIDSANRAASGPAWPERTYLLDIPWEESLKRRAKDDESDRMESNVTEFFHMVIAGYLTIAEQDRSRVRVLDGCRPVPELGTAIFGDALELIASLESDSKTQ